MFSHFPCLYDSMSVWKVYEPLYIQYGRILTTERIYTDDNFFSKTTGNSTVPSRISCPDDVTDPFCVTQVEVYVFTFHS